MSNADRANLAESVRANVRSYLFSKASPESIKDIRDSDSLLAAGVIDSVGMVDLIAHIEKTYRISIHEDEMIPENFDTLNALTKYIVDKSPAR